MELLKSQIAEWEKELAHEKEIMKDYTGDCLNVSLMYCEWLTDNINHNKKLLGQ